MIQAGIQIEGLKEFRKDLKRIDEELTKELRSDLLVIAREIAREAAQRVPANHMGFSGNASIAAASIRGGVSGNNAYVAGGNAATPYYPWLDFGSREPISGRPRSVGPWKGSGGGPQGGRFIYPTIVRNHREIETKAHKAFDKAAEAALDKQY